MELKRKKKWRERKNKMIKNIKFQGRIQDLRSGGSNVEKGGSFA